MVEVEFSGVIHFKILQNCRGRSNDFFNQLSMPCDYLFHQIQETGRPKIVGIEAL